MTITTDLPADAAALAVQERRASFVAGLRAYADALEANPETLPLPYHGIDTEIVMYFLDAADPRAEMAAAVRALPCNFTKSVMESSLNPGGTLRLSGKLHGLGVELVAYRNAVCERVVTGTREVTKTVKDPEALAAVPEIEVTETVEDVEWRCGSILAPAPAGNEASA
jgi:hypothetical protein